MIRKQPDLQQLISEALIGGKKLSFFLPPNYEFVYATVDQSNTGDQKVNIEIKEKPVVWTGVASMSGVYYAGPPFDEEPPF